MDSNRLKQIEEIYHLALETPLDERKDFINKQCDNDIDLRREVESLLSFTKTSDNLLNTPPESFASEMLAEQDGQANLINEEIGHYKIIKLLGKGGMGEVYLANDTKLDRKAAIKFMDERYVEEASNLNRFFFEAKSSSALNHPNIITVYEIGEFEKRPFIVTEFIDGITIKEYLSEKKPSLVNILDVAIQIASALSSAHKAGIIHRDIKPENMMIRGDGIIKVLDFGIAKYDSTEIDNEANTLAKISTIRGVIMGTPHFMSPEQARGKSVDTRTDIWSFGVLFYQMLTQKLPFRGETISDVIASILKTEPQPIKDFVPEISPTLENIVLRTFEKDPKERPQKIDEILLELKNYKRELEQSDETVPFKPQISDRFLTNKATDNSIVRTTAKDPTFSADKSDSIFTQTISKAREFPFVTSIIGLTLFSIFVILGIGVSKSNLFSDEANSFNKMKLAKLTYDGTVANTVAISPDGKFVVYVLVDEEKQTLMVRQIAASTAVERIPAASVNYLGLAFTPDGNNIFYTVEENGVHRLYDIPVIGGNPRKITENIDGKVTFSPDGKTMAFVRSRNLLMLADINGGSERVLAKSSPQEIRKFLDWNPNGESIMSSVYSSEISNEYLSEVSISDGTEKRFPTTAGQTINSLNWLADGSGIIISGRDSETKFSQVWKISYPEGKESRITNDFSTYADVGLTAKNDTLVTVKEDRIFNLWVSSTDSPNTSKQITFEEGKDDGTSGVAWAPDGKIIYTIRPNKNIELWSVNSDGSEKRKLTNDQYLNYFPVVSPDGQYIVFNSTRADNLDIWRMDIDGGNPVALTDSPDVEENPNFTPDGKWILYERRNADKITTIWKVHIDGGKPIQLTRIDTRRPSVSPDGKFIACKFGDSMPETSQEIAIFPIEGGKPLATPDFPAVANSRSFRWSFDSKSLIYLERKNRVSNLWSQPLDKSPPKQLTFIESGQLYGFSFTKNGENLIVSRGNQSTDIVMISNFN